jgi:hypothetical protein
LPQRRICCSLLFATFAILQGCHKTSGPTLEQPAPHQPAASSSPTAAPIPATPQPAADQGTRASGPIHFTDVTAQAGIHFKHNSGAFGQKYLPETMGSGACFIDYDNDGYQDILLINSKDWPGHQSHKSYPALYHNNHDGTFTDVTRQAHLDIELYGMGCAIGD